MIFCGISKAFDRVWHHGLPFKLKQNELDCHIIYWIEDYHISRKQKVFVF